MTKKDYGIGGRAVMDLLWSGGIYSNLKKIKKPSPALKKYIPDLARDPAGTVNYSNCFAQKSCCIKDLSLPVLFSGQVKASMTVEAALVLPLLCFFILNLSCAVEMVRLHNNVQMALWDTGSRLAIYGYDLEGREDAASLFSAFYIKSRIRAYLGEGYLEQSPMRGGIDGLHLWESGMFTESDQLDISATYQVSPWCSLAAFPSFRMSNRFCIHIWSGYRIPEESRDAIYVYVAEHGEVYHISRDCTHLTLSVRQTLRAGLETLRNQNGRSYRACGKCAAAEGGATIFVTKEGEHYHASASCPGLKRTVYMIPKDQAAGYRMCSRCGGG